MNELDEFFAKLDGSAASNLTKTQMRQVSNDELEVMLSQLDKDYEKMAQIDAEKTKEKLDQESKLRLEKEEKNRQVQKEYEEFESLDLANGFSALLEGFTNLSEQHKTHLKKAYPDINWDRQDLSSLGRYSNVQLAQMYLSYDEATQHLE